MKVIQFPNPILRQVSKSVTEFNEELHKELDLMKETLIEYNAAGIAAIQIGIPKRIILIRDNNGDIVEMINPEVLDASKERQYLEEGCLSFGDIRVQIQRPLHIFIQYQSRDGEKHNAIVQGIEAIEFSHETDHLEGILIIDRVNRQMRKSIEKILGKENK